MNLNTLNALLRKRQIPVKAIKGEGYFYWVDMRPGPFFDYAIDGASTMVCKSSHLSEEQWLSEAHAAAAIAQRDHRPERFLTPDLHRRQHHRL